MNLGPDEIRAALERVLAANTFKRSERLCRFLSFVVNSALEGKHEQLKEYVLGVEVYQKGSNFDPRVDSTVRVEAARLRSKLHEYYANEGRSDLVRIEIPKGGYTPRFEHAQPPVVQTSRQRVLVWPLALAGVLFAAAIVLLIRPRPNAVAMAKPFTTWLGEELEPGFSPDGKQLAMVWSGEDGANYDIYVKPVGEGQRLRLTTHPARERRPAWSPDGRLIAFLRVLNDGSEVYVVPAVGGAERLIAKVRPFTGVMEWCPDAQALIVLDKESDDGPFRIYRLSLATGEKRPLTSPPPQSYGDLQAALSPDGQSLAFVRSASIPASDIYVMPTSGGNPRRLTFENQVISGLAWSADGKSIILSSERGATAGAGSLWRIPAYSSNPQPRLEPVPGAGPRATWPAVARQGALLAYQELLNDTNLWRAPVAGGVPEPVNSSTREEARPDYSPDGSLIAFNSNRSGNWEVWIADSDGTNPRQMTSFGGTPAWVPRWSPDGRLIAFFHASEGNSDIYTVTPEGGSVRRLTKDPSHEQGPSWSRDGKWLYFVSNRSGKSEIWKMAAANPSQVIQVTRGGGAWPAESPDGDHLYFRRGIELWKMPTTAGAESQVQGSFPATQEWTLDSAGMYYAALNGEIGYYRFDTGATTSIIPAPTPRSNFPIRGLTLSPDARWLLYGRLDRRTSDIMLLEKFH